MFRCNSDEGLGKFEEEESLVEQLEREDTKSDARCQAGKCIAEGNEEQKVLVAWPVQFVSLWNLYSSTMLQRLSLLVVPYPMQFSPYVPPLPQPKDLTHHR